MHGRFDHSEPSGKPGYYHGWRIGSSFDLGSLSEGIPGPRSAGEEICSVGFPSVREGEFVDIEVDSGAEVSCHLAHVGADTHPQHETRLSMCVKSTSPVTENHYKNGYVITRTSS